jgi:hypothetical protein
MTAPGFIDGLKTKIILLQDDFCFFTAPNRAYLWPTFPKTLAD